MSVRALSPATRVIIGVLGAASLVICLILAATEIRIALSGNGTAWAAALVLAAGAFVALRVLRAAIRGTITVRDRRP